MIDRSQIYSVILAGGGARRLGGGQKALVELAGKPLIEHLIARWQGLGLAEDRLAINANLSREHLGQYQYPVFPDRNADERGPLLGVWSALHWVRQHHSLTTHLLILPCDTPFFPDDLVEQFCQMDERKIAVASYQDHLQPTFSLWPVGMFTAVENAIFALDMHGFMEFLDVHPHQPCEWPERAENPFLNINTPEDLSLAEQRLQAASSP